MKKAGAIALVVVGGLGLLGLGLLLAVTLDMRWGWTGSAQATDGEEGVLLVRMAWAMGVDLFLYLVLLLVGIRTLRRAEEEEPGVPATFAVLVLPLLAFGTALAVFGTATPASYAFAVHPMNLVPKAVALVVGGIFSVLNRQASVREKRIILGGR